MVSYVMQEDIWCSHFIGYCNELFKHLFLFQYKCLNLCKEKCLSTSHWWEYVVNVLNGSFWCRESLGFANMQRDRWTDCLIKCNIANCCSAWQPIVLMEVWIPLAKLEIYFDGNRCRAVMGAEARKQNWDLLSGAAGEKTFTPFWG